ncbi:histidine kinase [Cellulomonas soli]|uniref:Histidine kinase n=1 Tax=Cellulomonas soli TaxID=931535 RepID=A0A512PC05_9CELL|nr:histidine kinase [Cellulomonas soli]NYI58307.1 hypothetical protein [Cellulomonas soli]GEP68728.1 hypothetical protein CSO01_14430 [Cellulomonas soli]
MPDTPAPTPDGPDESSAPPAPAQPAGTVADPVAEPDAEPVADPGVDPSVDLDVEQPPVPSEVELERLAEPATVRHAPRFGAFLVAGGIVGIVVGVGLALVTGEDSPIASTGGGFLPFLDGQGAVRTVLGVTGAVVGVALGGLLAVLADRRSVRASRR